MSLVECKAGKFEGLFQDNCHQFFGIPYANMSKDGMSQLLLKKNLIFKAFRKRNSAPQTRSDDQSQWEQAFFKTILYPNNLKIA